MYIKKSPKTTKRWWADRRVSRRKVMASMGGAGLGAVAIGIVGCGDDDDDAPAAAQAPAAQTPAAQTPAAQAPAEQMPDEQMPTEQMPDEAPAPAPEPAADVERDLIVAQATLWTTLDQELASVNESQEASVNEHAQLMRYAIKPTVFDGDYLQQSVAGQRDDFQMMLAEDWDRSDDRTTYTFKLREGVASPWGNELTADDVVYTQDRKFHLNLIGAFVQDFALGLYRNRDDFDIDSQVQRIDDYTVQFRLPQPFTTFEHAIANNHGGSVVDSRRLIENSTEADPWAAEWAVNNAHGHGPYYVESFTQGQEALWLRNENWVGGNPNRPERMIWRVVPETSTRLSLVKRGDVHIARQMLAREQVDAAASEGIFVPDAFTDLSLWATMNFGVQPFDDVRVRQAFLQTIPYDEVINTVYQGRARRQFGMVWDPIPGSRPDLFEPYVKTDIDSARALLEEAGLGDGFSFEMGFELAFPDQEEAVILMRESAAQAGIDMQLKGLTPSESNENRSIGDEGLPGFMTRDYAIVQTIPYYLGLFFTPDSILNWAGWHKGRAQSAEFWQALEAGVNVGDDLSEEAFAHFADAQRIVAEDAPMAWMCWTDPSWIWRDNLGGYYHRTDNQIDYGEVFFTS